MKIGFVSLFPEVISVPMGSSILGRAQSSGAITLAVSNPRDFATDAHKTVDDKPYGGGPGMVMMAPIVDAALKDVRRSLHIQSKESVAIVVPDPTGSRFCQQDATELSNFDAVIFVCGHYEGIDERFVALRATHRLSLGDFVLTGGELAGLAMADAVIRILPGVLGDPKSLEIDSHSDGLLSSPQYTHPEVWEDMAVPEILRSGNHKAMLAWKRQISLLITRERRPDLFALAKLEKGDADVLSF